MRVSFGLAPALLVLLYFSALVSLLQCNANSTNETSTEPTPEPIVYETVQLELYFPHTECAGGEDSVIPRPEALSVRLPSGPDTYTLREVLEAATDQDESYQFSLLFLDYDFGYLLEGINGTDEERFCQWAVFYQAPGDILSQLRNLHKFMGYIRIEFVASIAPDSTVVMSYQDNSPPPSVDPPTDPTTPPTDPTSPTTTDDPESVAPSSSLSATSSSSSSEVPTTSSTTEQTTTPTDLPTPRSRGAALGLSTSTHIMSLIVSTSILCMYLV
jgi:hypothetical protein